MNDPILQAAAGLTQPGNPAGSDNGQTQQGNPDAGQGQTQVQTGDPTGNQSSERKWPEWQDQFAKELQGHEKLVGHKKPTDLGKAFLELDGKYAEAEKRLAAAIVKPAPDAPKEDWDKYYAAQGVPEKSDGYEFKRSGDLEKVPRNEAVEAQFKDLFHGLKVPKETGERLYEALTTLGVEAGKKVTEARVAEAKAAETALRKEFGREYDEKMAFIAKAATGFFGEDTWKRMSADLGNDVNFMKGLASLGRYMSDDSIVEGKQRPGQQSPYDWSLGAPQQ